MSFPQQIHSGNLNAKPSLKNSPASNSAGKNRSWFQRFSSKLAQLSGKASTFLLAVILIIVWALTGPMFGFNDTWQLVINTSTTIITFLMVFLIQNTQNRDTAAIHIKLDELIRAQAGAHNALLDLEELDELTLQEFRNRYEELAERSRNGIKTGSQDTDSPDIDCGIKGEECCDEEKPEPRKTKQVK
jgi:low affinity Fe/Cu permease